MSHPHWNCEITALVAENTIVQRHEVLRTTFAAIDGASGRVDEGGVEKIQDPADDLLRHTGGNGEE